jgi:hypothetical protein
VHVGLEFERKLNSRESNMAELARRDNPLVGTWKLLSFHYEFDDADERDEPFGAEPVGYLVITEERLITLMTARERVTDAAARELLDGMLAYSGRYRLQGDDCFITTVDSAWQPAWIGTEQVRFFKIDGEILAATSSLREVPKYPERRLRGVAVWRKD